ncbi:MAG: hypothetical protein D6677_13580, partial [Calditrichaeota bacterium]
IYARRALIIKSAVIKSIKFIEEYEKIYLPLATYRLFGENSLKNKTVYKIFSIGLPFVLWMILEFTFRLSNIYAPPPLYTQTGPNQYQLNARAAERYFNSAQINIPLLFPQRFSKKRPKNSLRIICLGGSTTAGFPYDVNVPFPAQLKMLLNEKWPDKDIEVINMGLSAINSFTVWDWLPDIIRLKPDYVLIYMGHNEFYGAFGSGSSIGIGQNGTVIRLYLRLQHFYTVQALKHFIHGFIQPGRKASATLMSQVIANRNIEKASAAYNQAVRNYMDNLDDIVRQLSASGIKIVISTLVSNLKDQPPLEDAATHKKSVAGKSYKQGQLFLKKGLTSKAFQAFKNAKESDRLRFRAPDTINAIIKNISKKYNTALIDMDSLFRQENTLPGYKLFSDHLHPNPAGYALMARSFYLKLTDSRTQFPDSAKALNVTQLDWQIGSIRIAYLKHHWPFSKKPFNKVAFRNTYSSPLEKIAYAFVFEKHNWPLAHTQMAAIYEKTSDFKSACREYLAISAIYPKHRKNTERLINCAQKAGLWPLVEKESRIILKEADHKGKWYFRLALAQFNQEKFKAAFENIQKAIVAPELTIREKAVSEGLLARFLMALGKKKAAQKVLDHIKSYNRGIE